MKGCSIILWEDLLNFINYVLQISANFLTELCVHFGSSFWKVYKQFLHRYKLMSSIVILIRLKGLFSRFIYLVNSLGNNFDTDIGIQIEQSQEKSKNHRIFVFGFRIADLISINLFPAIPLTTKTLRLANHYDCFENFPLSFFRPRVLPTASFPSYLVYCL